MILVIDVDEKPYYRDKIVQKQQNIRELKQSEF